MRKLFKYKKLILLTAFSLPFFVAFQNCSKVNLKDSSEIKQNLINLKNGQGEVCLPNNYTLESFFVTNLNIKSTQFGLESDSDGDGLSDREEHSFGTNPYLRRTNSNVLDSICREVDYNGQCKNLNFSCDKVENLLGFNECDLMALQITTMAIDGAGVDSDQDGIPDYLEMRIGSFPNIADSFNDLDVDQVNNFSEAELGTSIDENNKYINNDYKVVIDKVRTSHPGCSGEYWEFRLLNLPTTVVDYFNDVTENTLGISGDRFSHVDTYNVIQYFIKISPIANPSAKAKTYTYYQKVLIDSQNTQNNLNISFDLVNNYSGDVKQ